MVTTCWAVKGGSGTTVVTAALALSSTRPALLVDLDGELPLVLGIDEPDRPGVGDWIDSDASTEVLGDLLVPLAPEAWLLPWRTAGTAPVAPPSTPPDRLTDLAAWLTDWSERWNGDVTIDAGTGQPPAVLHDRSDRSLLVTRACYVSLKRAVRSPVRPTGVVLVDEPGRSITPRDIEHALGVPVEARVALDPAIARAVDAGLLAHRLPRVMSRAIRGVAR